jgi:hypothetical protein
MVDSHSKKSMIGYAVKVIVILYVFFKLLLGHGLQIVDAI